MTEWLTPKQVADRLGRHPDSVRRALEAGQLHGHQPKRRGRWQIHPDAIDAWIRGMDGREACCGSNVVRLRRRNAA